MDSALITNVTVGVLSAGVGNLISPVVGKGLAALTRARAQQIEHVEASGVDLYGRGVPLTEMQFRDAFAAMEADLAQLSPPTERDRWQLMRQAEAINRFAVLAGTFPQPFPIRTNADDAWDWYRACGAWSASFMPLPDDLAVRYGMPVALWLA